jgi:hypothetical protein
MSYEEIRIPQELSESVHRVVGMHRGGMRRSGSWSRAWRRSRECAGPRT